MWTGKSDTTNVQTTYQYVVDLKSTLSDMVKLAQTAVQKAKKGISSYDQRSRMRVQKEGDEVLVLLPTDHNKLLKREKVNFFSKRTGVCYYVVKMNKDQDKLFHNYMLKKYI